MVDIEKRLEKVEYELRKVKDIVSLLENEEKRKLKKILNDLDRQAANSGSIGGPIKPR